MSKSRISLINLIRPATGKSQRNIANPRWMALLAAFETARSITAAARLAGFSYKGAWDAIDAMNNLAGTPLVAAAVGGKGGGGAGLTPRGREVIEAYRLVEMESQRLAARVTARMEAASAEPAAGVRTLDRLSLRTSARNQWRGEVVNVKRGAVNDEVLVRLASGNELAATITHESALQLGLESGTEVVALVKSSAVMVAGGQQRLKVSARNQFAGKVLRMVPGAVNTEVVIGLAEGQSVTAIITRAAVKELQLKKGAPARALFDASDVILAVH